MCREVHDKYADALITLAEKCDVPDKRVDVKIMKRMLWANEENLIPINYSMRKIGEVPLFEALDNLRQLWLQRIWKSLLFLVANSIIDVVVECWLEPYAWLRQK